MNKQLKAFFDKYIAAIQQSTDSNGFMDISIDNDRESYFTEPLRPEYLYLNSISFDTEGLRRQLNEMWKDDEALKKMIPDLIKLAFKMKENNIQQTEELSPFMYVMF